MTFLGRFTLDKDKRALVEVVLGLYALSVIDTLGEEAEPKSPDKSMCTTLVSPDVELSHVVTHKNKSVFPPEFFGGLIEVLEKELTDAAKTGRSAVFSPEQYAGLVAARFQFGCVHNRPMAEHLKRYLPAKHANTRKNRTSPSSRSIGLEKVDPFAQHSATLSPREVASADAFVSPEPLPAAVSLAC